MKALSMIITVCLIYAAAVAAEVIQGEYAYTYGDSESLVEARETCKALALREALESCLVFVEASTQVENFQLKEDIIHSLTAAHLKNVQILSQSESGRTLTLSVSAEVDPEEMKALIAEKQEESSASPLESVDAGPAAGPEGDTATSDFLGSLPAYETLLQKAESALKDKAYQKAIFAYNVSHQFLLSHPPGPGALFDRALYACLMRRSELVKTAAKLRLASVQNNPAQKANQRSILIKQRDVLKTAVEAFNRIDLPSENRTEIKKHWMQKCVLTLNNTDKVLRLSNGKKRR